MILCEVKNVIRHHRLHTPIHADRILHAILTFVRKNAVFCIAFLAALTTSFIVPPDEQYLSYPDYRTLACLFATLAVVGALGHISFFSILARRIVRIFKTLRSSVTALVCITFVGSMLIANDMALITFLPLGWYVLKDTGNTRYTAFVFIMQNIAANLGGMLTPFGNPQNLYLYSHFEIPTLTFMRVMLPPFLLATALIIAICMIFTPGKRLSLEKGVEQKLPIGKTALYLVLFTAALLMVFRVLPPLFTTLAIIGVLLFFDRDALIHLDYPLLLTFLCFFIFSSNMARIAPVSDLLSSLLSKDVLLCSTLSCQVISNVPSAILLSSFTQNYASLLVGVNIGGAGTLIASLASLITFREYQSHEGGSVRRYLLLFSAINFGLLLILFLFAKFVLFL